GGGGAGGAEAGPTPRSGGFSRGASAGRFTSAVAAGTGSDPGSAGAGAEGNAAASASTSRPPLRAWPVASVAAPLSFLRRKKLTIGRQCGGGVVLSAPARKMADHGSTAPRRNFMKRHGAKAGPRDREGSVRIIGGHWRGTRLPVADSAGLRPTSDRARETLFNWLQPVLPGARVLDLFAGSGA